jgi:hypothetical protein
MTIYLFKLVYPSGYTRYKLTLNEALRIRKERKQIKFNTDGYYPVN